MKRILMLCGFVFFIYLFALVIASEYNAPMYIYAILNILSLWLYSIIGYNFYKGRKITKGHKIFWTIGSVLLILIAVYLIIFKIAFSWPLLILLCTIFIIGLGCLLFAFKHDNSN